MPLTPIFTLMTSRVFFKQPIFRKEIVGALLGIAGTLLLIFTGAMQQRFGKVNYYIILPLLSCFCYGLNSNLIKTLSN